MNNTLEQKRAALNSKNVATLAIQARPSSHVLELLGNLQSEWSITFISSSAMMLNNWVNEERNVDINISEIVFKFYPIMQRQSLEWLIRSKHIWKKSPLSRETVEVQKKFLASKLVLKVYVLQAQLEKYRFCIFTSSYFAWLAENSPHR